MASLSNHRHWGAFQPNPLAAVVEVRTDDGDAGVTVIAPQRGRKLKPGLVKASAEPELFGALVNVARSVGGTVGSALSGLGPRHARRLRELGILLREARLPELPLFQCDLTKTSRRRESRLPAEVSALIRDPLHFADTPVVGVRDAGSGMVLPYWRNSKSNSGRASVSAEPRPTALRRQLDAARRSMSERGFGALARALPKTHLTALGSYFGRVVDNGLAPFDEEQRRWHRHNDPVARLFHCLITPLIAQIATEPIKRSYAYFAAYPRHSLLGKHTDREQCEYTVSMLIGHDSPEGRTLAWPIYLGRSAFGDERRRIVQRTGDMLIFKGREIPHWRPRLKTASRSLHIFFHFVPQSFDGQLD